MNFMHVPRWAAAARGLFGMRPPVSHLIKTHKVRKVLRLQHLIALTRGTKEMAQRLLRT